MRRIDKMLFNHYVCEDLEMAASAQYTYVYYFVPYDGDEEEHPNFFLIRKPPTSVTLEDVIKV